MLKKSVGAAAPAAADISVLLTPVDGKVFEMQKKRSLQKEQQKNFKDPEKVLAADFPCDGTGDGDGKKGKGKGKKAKAKPTAKAKDKAGKNREIEDDPGKLKNLPSAVRMV